MTALLTHLLTADPTPRPCADVDAWWPAMLAAAAPFAAPIDRSVAAGFAADRLGWAFAGGYHHALRALAPSLDPETPAALAATEEGGGHPRAMTVTLTARGDGQWALDGAKGFVTLGRHARALLVVATVGLDAAGRNRLRVARVDARAPGVSMSALPATPFAPEIEHARVVFADARVDEVLPGDGYERYLKPFRTLEDLHVVAAALGHMFAAARRRGWGDALCESLLAAVVTARALAAEDPASPATHVALAGLFAALDAATAQVDAGYAGRPDDEAARWARDQRLLRVAGRVRALRREAAWRALGSGAGGE